MKFTGGQGEAKLVCRSLEVYCGEVPAADLGPVLLSEVRRLYFAPGCGVRAINDRTNMVLAIWRFGVNREIIPVESLIRRKNLEPYASRDARLGPSRGIVTRGQLVAAKKILEPTERVIVGLMGNVDGLGESFAWLPSFLPSFQVHRLFA